MNEEEEFINNKPLINLALKRLNIHWSSTYEFEEYNDCGIDGLLQGIRTYDESKGVKKGTYYYACIKNQINRLVYLKQMKKRKGYCISYNTPVDEDGNEIIDFIASNTNIEKEVEEKLRDEKLLDLVNSLRPLDSEVIKRTYGLDGYEAISIRELAKEWGLNHNAVAERRKRALNQLWVKIKYGGL